MIRVHSWERTLRWALLVAGDCAIAAAAIITSVEFRRRIAVPGTEGLLPPEKFPLDAVNVGITIATLIVSLAASGFYAQRITARHRPMLGAALIAQVALLAVISTLIQRPYPRTILLAQPFLEWGLLVGWRRLFAFALPLRKRRTVLVGPAARVGEITSGLEQQQDGRIQVIGLVSTGQDGMGDSPQPVLPFLGRLGDVDGDSAVREAEEVVVVCDDPAVRIRMFELRGPTGYLAVPSHAEALLANPDFAWIGDQPLVEVAARSAFGPGRVIKRTIDLFFATLLLLLLLPVIAAVALAIVIESGRPILHVQSRRGRMGEQFAMLKFRTMRDRGARDDTLASDRDPRFTRIGRWLRRHRLDELPQLINVLRGEMSLVGPRPEQLDIHDRLSGQLVGFTLRLLVPPGATGLAQICADYDTTAATKLRYDLSYICSWSVWLDLRILLLSVSTSLSGRGV